MTVAQLAHPEWFDAVIWTLVAVGLCVLAAVWQGRRRRVLLMGIARAQTPRKWTSDWALVVALVAIGVALLGPRIGERLVDATANGVDLVIVIDVSRSMDAVDMPPSRLDRARRGIEELLARLEPTDRVALAAFASRGVLLTPLTPDRFALLDWMAALDTDLIRPASSNLQSGIEAAIAAFETGSERPRVIVVASDGEDPNGSSRLGVEPALLAQSRVIAMALGTELGSAIPASGSPLRDRVGRVVVSRRQGQRLTRLAEATSGAMFLADDWGAFDFDAVTAAVRRDAGTVSGERVERSVPAIRVAPFAALAFALLLAEGMPRMRFASRRRVSAAGAIALTIPLLGATPVNDESPPDPLERIANNVPDLRSENTSRNNPEIPPPEAVEPWVRREPRNARALIALGHSRLAHGQAVAAASAFSAATLYAVDARLAGLSHFGLGVALLQTGDLERARDAFFDALAVDPSDHKARYNLEWTLASLVETPPEQSRPSDESGADSDARPEPEDSDDPEPNDATPDAMPRENSDEMPERQTETAPSPNPNGAEPEPTRLSERQQLRSLARVTDDLGRSIRALVHADSDNPDARERRAGADW